MERTWLISALDPTYGVGCVEVEHARADAENLAALCEVQRVPRLSCVVAALLVLEQ
jgi:hypothetical protein